MRNVCVHVCDVIACVCVRPDEARALRWCDWGEMMLPQQLFPPNHTIAVPLLPTLVCKLTCAGRKARAI